MVNPVLPYGGRVFQLKSNLKLRIPLALSPIHFTGNVSLPYAHACQFLLVDVGIKARAELYQADWLAVYQEEEY